MSVELVIRWTQIECNDKNDKSMSSESHIHSQSHRSIDPKNMYSMNSANNTYESRRISYAVSYLPFLSTLVVRSFPLAPSNCDDENREFVDFWKKKIVHSVHAATKIAFTLAAYKRMKYINTIAHKIDRIRMLCFPCACLPYMFPALTFVMFSHGCFGSFRR